MTSTPWVPPTPQKPTARQWPGVMFAVGVVFAIASGCLAFFVVVLAPLVFYGDRDIPAEFSRNFDRFSHYSIPVAAGLTFLLLVAAFLLGRTGALSPERVWARVLSRVCLTVAVLTPWVWIVVAYSLARHWESLAPYA